MSGMRLSEPMHGMLTELRRGETRFHIDRYETAAALERRGLIRIDLDQDAPFSESVVVLETFLETAS